MSEPYLDLTKTKPNGSPQEAISSPKGIPFWGDYPDAYDTVVIGRLRFPGICRVSGVGFKQKLDKKTAPGQHGGSHAQLGHANCEINVTLKIFTKEHLEQLQLIIDAIKPKKASRNLAPEPRVAGFTSAAGASVAVPVPPKPASTSISPSFEIYHPMLALYRIHKVQVMEAGIPEYKEKEDYFEVKFKFTEIGKKEATVTTEGKWSLTDLGPKRTPNNTPSTRPPSKTNAGPTFRGRGATGSF